MWKRLIAWGISETPPSEGRCRIESAVPLLDEVRLCLEDRVDVAGELDGDDLLVGPDGIDHLLALDHLREDGVEEREAFGLGLRGDEELVRPDGRPNVVGLPHQRDHARAIEPEIG